MSRAEKSTSTRNAIIDATRDLFFAQGYKSTTIRQITEKANVLNGTLYHFFKDKEQILLQIVIDAYGELMTVADDIIGNESDPALRFAVIYLLEMKAIQNYPNIAELYLESYSSWRITDELHPLNVNLNKQFFGCFNDDFRQMDYHMITLALRGMKLVFISERINIDQLDFREKCSFLIRSSLTMFNVPQPRITKAIDHAFELMSKDTWALYDLTL